MYLKESPQKKTKNPPKSVNNNCKSAKSPADGWSTEVTPGLKLRIRSPGTGTLDVSEDRSQQDLDDGPPVLTPEVVYIT